MSTIHSSGSRITVLEERDTAAVASSATAAADVSPSKALPGASSAAEHDNVLIIPPISIGGSERFPAMLVWCPLPLLTWLFPAVGHMGIATSDGVVHDFAGPYYINEDSALAFGPVARCLSMVPYIFKEPVFSTRQLADGSWEVRKNVGHPAAAAHPDCVQRLAQYDAAIERQADRFRRSKTAGGYSLCTNNCHSFVAYCLEDAGTGSWNMFKLAAIIFYYGSFVTWGRMLMTWAPFAVIVLVVWLVAR